MPSHLSDIGFQLETEEAFQQLTFRACDEGDAFETGAGTYIRWVPGAGIELWFQLDREANVIAMNPHFAGSSLMRVGLTRRIARSDDGPLEGAFYAWASPEGGEPEMGYCPLVFDVPDYHLNSTLLLPSIVDVQLSAFAEDLHSYESDEAYDESQTGEIKFAAESFIPSGIFFPDGSSIDSPQAQAILTGHVLETSLITNPVTDKEFLWAKVRTLGGEIDVVADPVLLNGPIVKGGVVSGSFWLSGQIIRSS